MEIDLSSPLGILKFYGELLSGPKKKKAGDNAIAIVYVEGMILPGSSDPSGIPASERRHRVQHADRQGA